MIVTTMGCGVVAMTVRIRSSARPMGAHGIIITTMGCGVVVMAVRIRSSARPM